MDVRGHRMKGVGIKHGVCRLNVACASKTWRGIFLSQPRPGSEGLREQLGIPEVMPGLQEEGRACAGEKRSDTHL